MTVSPLPLAQARRRVAEQLGRVAERTAARGMARWGARGKLIRPLVAYACAQRSPSLLEEDSPFWNAVAAVQLAHEASLVHDDVVDRAPIRRGRPTLVANEGVAAALLHGDHLLTTAYRLASFTQSARFVELFARAVERTVAAETEQAGTNSAILDLDTYRRIITGKSGELLGAAAAAGPALEDDPATPRYYALGSRLGLVYQMLDDLLDYCPAARSDKPTLMDCRQGRWTWPLVEVAAVGFEDSPDEIVERLNRVDGAGPRGSTPLSRCLARLDEEIASVRREAEALIPGDVIVPELLEQWMAEARRAVRASSPADGGPRVETGLGVVEGGSSGSAGRTMEFDDVPDGSDALATHSKSFHFAARLFPREARERAAAVYAYCRYVDDIVDRSGRRSPAEIEARLDAWLERSRRAYEGRPTEIGLLDRAMEDMARAGVPFVYAEDLVEGMRMDLRGTRYERLEDLERYTYRVASVVGLWLTELFEVHDAGVLERAATMGHAMQLTNILRDVGEDLRAGRIYLPRECLERHGLGVGDLERMHEAGTVVPAYVELLEELMGVADAAYDDAFRAIPALPGFFGRPVAVAAYVHRGIHDGIRRNG